MSNQNQTKLFKIVYILFNIVIFCTASFCIYYLFLHIIQGNQFNIANEYRDFSLLRIVQFFLDGKNPYTLEFQSQLNSPELFQYTLLVPIMATIFTPLFGGNILLTYYILNIFYIGLTVVLLSYILKKWIPNIKYYWYIVIFIHTLCMFTMIFGGGAAFTFRPDAIGIVVMAILYYLIYDKRQYVFLISFLSVLLIFTKQFFVLMALPITMYYIIYNKKLALKYIIYCIILGILSIIGIQLIFPLYWTHTIYSQFLSDVTLGSLFDSIKNFGLYILRVEMLPVFLSSIFFIVACKKTIFSNQKANWLLKIKENLYISFLFFSVIIYGLFLLWLAQTKGDGFKYLNSLLSSPLLLLSIYFINAIFIKFPKKSFQQYSIIINISIALLFVLTPLPAFSWNSYSSAETSEWKNLYALCDEYEPDRTFLSPMPSSYFLERENAIYDGYYDDGHLEYFQYTSETKFDSLFYGVSEERQIVSDFRNTIAQKIQNGEFDLIIIPYDYWLFNNELLEKHYTISKQLNLVATCNSSTVNVWLKKEK